MACEGAIPQLGIGTAVLHRLHIKELPTIVKGAGQLPRPIKVIQVVHMMILPPLD